MSDEGEKTCPLCAEEMDLTDQHLKPCRCGYQICVWCWHHIIEMAEKDKTEGRCPACRTPYDKEKIVGTAVKCERLAAEVNVERKKSQKTKPKPSEGRKQLSNVRVIQRNLVYVVGLPLDLADENLLQHKEYFGQYGKVLKVSMSRTAAGVVQQFPNSTCSVYITYSKEEEAIRCIQFVHGFILDGRPLKACFGTTKYCHAWVRNVLCTNPDCLYLHEIGSQEDSFTKDEIISAYMRSKVQEITGVANNLQRRAGSVLPPPTDDHGNNSSSTRPIPKVASNNAQSSLSSPPNSSASRSVALPAGASWGMRSSSQPPPAPSTGSLIESVKGKPKPSLTESHSDVLNPALEENRNPHGTVNSELPIPTKQLTPLNGQPKPSLSNRTQSSDKGALVSASLDDRRVVSVLSNCTDSYDLDGTKGVSGSFESLFSNAESVISDKGVLEDHHGLSDHDFNKSFHVEASKQHYADDEDWEALASESSVRTATLANETCVSRTETDVPETDDDISSFHRQRLKDPEVISRPANLTHSTNMANHMQSSSSRYKTEFDASSHGYTAKQVNGSSLEHSNWFSDKASESQGYSSNTIDNSIIANILSLDLDESLTLPHNLAKLLRARDEETGSLQLSSSRKVENNQSRFSFARQEEPHDQAFESYNHMSSHRGFYQDSAEIQDPHMDKFGMFNGFSSNHLRGFDSITANTALSSSDKLPSFQRSQVSAPPGFSVPSRSPPPGFSSNGRIEQQTFDGASGKNLFESMLANSYQPPRVENYSRVGDIELMDPAILAVGQGRFQGGLDLRTNSGENMNNFGNEAKLHQLLMQNSQNLRFSALGDGSLSVNNSFGISSRLIDEAQGYSNGISSPYPHLMPNGQYGWSNDNQGGNRVDVADLLRNERLGFNNVYGNYERASYRMPSSGDIYNRNYRL